MCQNSKYASFWFSYSFSLDILRLTCVYLACKVEEFYVPIGQFVKNLRGDREKFADAILSFELTLMSKLKYHLTIHNPFRPMEGFLIDIKVNKANSLWVAWGYGGIDLLPASFLSLRVTSSILPTVIPWTQTILLSPTTVWCPWVIGRLK